MGPSLTDDDLQTMEWSGLHLVVYPSHFVGVRRGEILPWKPDEAEPHRGRPEGGVPSGVGRGGDNYRWAIPARLGPHSLGRAYFNPLGILSLAGV